jgi:hypothetical protein
MAEFFHNIRSAISYGIETGQFGSVFPGGGDGPQLLILSGFSEPLFGLASEL